MHKVTAKSILTKSNGMNIYRGCTHGCIYCDARSTCYQINHAFEDIQVKINGPELLDEALSKRRKKCMIGTGGMTDPYLHLEEDLRLTRQCLQVIERHGFGVTLHTKSDRILQDLDLLKRINNKTKCVVQMTLTTYDDALCRIVEPKVCVTSRRLEVLRIFREEGIPTVVWMTPILPFINDTVENIRQLMIGCGEAGVSGVLNFGLGLTLRDGDRQYYYSNLDKHFPGLSEKYRACYGNDYGLAPLNQKVLYELLVRACSHYGIVYKDDEIFKYLNTFEEKSVGKQMTLFDL